MYLSSYTLGRSLAGLLIIVLMSLATSNVLAQSGGGVDQTGTGGRHSIQGRIYFPSGRRNDVRIKIRLESFNAGELSVLSDPNGSFVFRGLEPGNYTVVVDAGDPYEPARESVYIDTDGSNSRRGITLPPVARLYTVDISLRLKRDGAVKPSVVNAALAALPDNARDLYRKAVDSIQEGNTAKAVEELKAAIASYPQFPLALNELGVQYLKLGQLDKAAEALKEAVRLVPEDFLPRLNYGIVLLNQRKFPEAEEQLRVATSKNSNAATAHMYFGIVLAVQRKLEDGQKELELAIASNSPEVALAHRYLAGIHLERRAYKQAAEELQKYLELVPKAADAEVLHRKIKELRSKK
ncbi:MAG TPA: tetratricopeptide repeat protein [Pyrinomonadaceae bacterium]|nr:tetratricopeptide repeat protein [Pyrinomonadaceae bacterium]